MSTRGMARLSGWIWDFSSTQGTTAAVGRPPRHGSCRRRHRLETGPGNRLHHDVKAFAGVVRLYLGAYVPELQMSGQLVTFLSDLLSLGQRRWRTSSALRSPSLGIRDSVGRHGWTRAPTNGTHRAREQLQ